MKSGICICMKRVIPDDNDVIKCEICALTMHFNCYTGNNDDKLEIIEPLCITCTVNKINPFEKVDATYLNPVIMPKKPDIKTGTISGNFLLTEETLKKIKMEGNYKIFLYSVLHDSRFLTEKEYIWPNGFNILFNNHKLRHSNFEPIDITRFSKLNSNSLIFQYKQLDKEFIFFVLGTRPVLPKDLYNTLERFRQLSPDDCKVKICKMLNNSGIEKENISLKCTFSSGIMNTPVRGTNCQHINCFDLFNYITYAKSTKRWKCPICKKITYFRDLYIDTFIKSIIDEFKTNHKDVDSYLIFIDKNGNKTFQKYETKYSSMKTNYFNNEKIEKNAEQKNYSPNRNYSQKDLEMDLEKEEEEEVLEEDKETQYLNKIVFFVLN